MHFYLHPILIFLGVMFSVSLTQLEPRSAGTLNKRIVIVVDASCSMEADENFSRALTGTRMILEQPTDDMEVAVIAFGMEAIRYPTNGFLKLPSLDAVEALTKACVEAPVNSAGTNVRRAMKRALTEPKDVSIVLVSDGDFVQGDGDQVMKQVGKRPIMCLLTDKSQVMQRIGRESGGGAWLLQSDP